MQKTLVTTIVEADTITDINETDITLATSERFHMVSADKKWKTGDAFVRLGTFAQIFPVNVFKQLAPEHKRSGIGRVWPGLKLDEYQAYLAIPLGAPLLPKAE